jgi:hypothetical protein
MRELKQSNPLPNETNSHGKFFVKISVSKVTKTDADFRKTKLFVSLPQRWWRVAFKLVQ